MTLKTFIQKRTNQVLSYWEANRPGGFGNTTFKSPVELFCRWEDIQQEVIGPDGRTKLSNAHIIIRSQMLVVASVIMLGTLADWKRMPTYPKVPTNAQGGYEVFKASHTPGLKGEDLLYEVWC